MNTWSEPLTKYNMKAFIQEYAPMAYKAAYRVLGDTTRAENVLVESFVETLHYRSKDGEDSPLFIFGDILEKKVKTVSSKYPVPASITVKPRTLDEFTQTTIISEVERRINSFSFRIMDVLVFSDRSIQKRNNSSIISRVVSGAVDLGINLLLIIQMMIVIVLLVVVTFLGATSLFGANDFIITSPFREAQRNTLSIGEAIRYMPVEIVVRPDDELVNTVQENGVQVIPVEEAHASDLESDEPDDSVIESSEEESSEPSLSATRG